MTCRTLRTTCAAPSFNSEISALISVKFVMPAFSSISVFLTFLLVCVLNKPSYYSYGKKKAICIHHIFKSGLYSNLFAVLRICKSLLLLPVVRYFSFNDSSSDSFLKNALDIASGDHFAY